MPASAQNSLRTKRQASTVAREANAGPQGGGLARKRFQRGELFLRGKRERVWVGRWREDVIQPDGATRRPYRSVILGTQRDYPTRRLALRLLEARLTQVNDPAYRPRPEATFEQFAKRWSGTVLVQHKRSTQSAMRSHINVKLLPYFGKKFLHDLEAQPEAIQAWVSRLQCSPKTVRNVVITFRMMWKSAKAWGYVKHNVFEDLVLPKRVLVRRFSLTLEEIRRIIATAEGPFKTFCWLAAETGLRCGELCALRVRDLLLDDAIVQVRQSVWHGDIQTVKSLKGNREFAISPQLAEHLGEYVETWRPNPLNLLFPSKNGTPWDANLLRKRKFHPLLKRLGIERCGFHAFRHGNSTLLDQLQAPLKLRLNRLGHSSANVTMGYTHVIGADDRKVASELGKLLLVAPKPKTRGLASAAQSPLIQ
jgi:integrase